MLLRHGEKALTLCGRIEYVYAKVATRLGRRITRTIKTPITNHFHFHFMCHEKESVP